MREAPRELGEGFAVYSAELKRAANRLHVYGHYRPGAAGRQRPLLGRLHLTSRAVTVVVKQSPMVEQAGYPTLWPSLFATFDRLSKS
jgi:hypothetical protein